MHRVDAHKGLTTFGTAGRGVDHREEQGIRRGGRLDQPGFELGKAGWGLLEQVEKTLLPAGLGSAEQVDAVPIRRERLQAGVATL